MDGLEALIVTFPEYKADPEIKIKKDFEIPFTDKKISIDYKAPKVPSGHAGVLLIEPNGATRYFEYGRYITGDDVPGKARKVGLENNVTFGKDGLPTNESLNRVLGEISRKSGDGGSIKAAYIETDQVQSMLDYAYGKVKESTDPNREPYKIGSNNCGTFSCDVVGQDPSVDQPNILIPTPNNIVDEYIEEGNREINYNPKTNSTTVGEGNEKDAKKQP